MSLSIYYFCSSVIPESARWLASKGKMVKYEKYLRHVAKVNSVRLSDTFFSEKGLLEASGSEQKQERIWHLLSSPIMLFRTAILCFNWYVSISYIIFFKLYLGKKV